MDNESFELAAGNTAPIALSLGEYGTKQALPRILDLYDKYHISGSFYIPGVTGLLYPELVSAFKSRPQHEIGIHGWIHENACKLNDAAEEERLLHRALHFWTVALGKKPVGYRAPGWAWSQYTLDLIRQAGFEYDSSAMGMDEPYELLSYGQPTGIVELPVDWSLDDAPYFWWPAASMPSPKLTFEVYQDEFDQAHRDGTLFMLTLHPMITGHRSRMIHLERLILHMKSKPGVWFATAQQIVHHIKQESGLSREGVRAPPSAVQRKAQDDNACPPE